MSMALVRSLAPTKKKEKKGEGIQPSFPWSWITRSLARTHALTHSLTYERTHLDLIRFSLGVLYILGQAFLGLLYGRRQLGRLFFIF